MKTLGNLLHVPPKVINQDSLYLVGLVTVATIIHMISFMQRVGAARHKYKIMPPKTDGDARFTLVYRAHQNCVENLPIFLATLWSAAIFFHQVPAAILGVMYILGRELYFSGYSSKAERRLPGFLFSTLCVLCLLILTGLGTSASAYKAYRGKDFLQGWLQLIPVPLT